MKRGGDAASKKTAPSDQITTAALTLTAQVDKTIANSDEQLDQLSRLTKLSKTSQLCETDNTFILPDSFSSQDSSECRHVDQVRTIERAARALTVRTLQLDNAALNLADREAQLLQRQRQFEDRCNQTLATFRAHEEALAVRQASITYSAVEQDRLHARSLALDRREAELAELEAREMRRVAIRRDELASREQALERAHRQSQAQLSAREALLESRENSVVTREQDLADTRTHMLLQIEVDRANFWKHVQTLSADLAEEIASLELSYRSLREEFDFGADFARHSLRQLTHSVEKARFHSLVVENHNCDNHDSSSPAIQSQPRATSHAENSDRNHLVSTPVRDSISKGNINDNPGQ